MLSPRDDDDDDDDDDDSHLCIKCNATVLGLDNYVKHRKERCGKKYESKTPKPDHAIPPLDPFDPTYSLGADFFFQSLELQSTVKTTPLSRLSPPPLPPVHPTSKVIDERKQSLAVTTSSRITRVSPLDSNLRGEDWIGGHSLRIGPSEDNQTKLINAVANISGTAKKEIPTSSYNALSTFDYKGDEESDDSLDESNEEDEDEHARGGKWKPPIEHTGGKWRPATPDHEDWEMKEHTGGKWKMIMPADVHERDDDYDAPPPGHTKGKWVPGAQEHKIMQTTIQTKSSVQYWCGPCNRRLASRVIYEKHLMSSLHLRKVIPERDLEYSGHLEPHKLSVRKSTRPRNIGYNRNYQILKRKRKISDKEDQKIKSKRKRLRYYTHCSGCDSRVKLHFMGKHLISHYHFRKATNIQSDVYQKLIIENIDSIVHQCPFQCSPCKFYANRQTYFIQHWLSEEHKNEINSIEGKLWCSFCKFDCETSEGMFEHMSGADHGEVAALINRSMPIIMRKKTDFKCINCDEQFRYNIEIKTHCQKTGHELAYTATDAYQELHKCHMCTEKFKTTSALAGHLKITHKQKSFYCMVCSKAFDTHKDARRHRFTSEHKIKRKEKQRERGVPIKDMSRKCPYCVNVVLKNVLELKQHMMTVHPEIKKKCPKCGMTFTLSQEVTSHVRSNACQFQPPASEVALLWNCSQCLFTTSSQAECYFHEVLHTEPSSEIVISGDKQKTVEKYPCPICSKMFLKSSLRFHLMQHTLERPFACSICKANFTRHSSLANHIRMEHGQLVRTSTRVTVDDEGGDDNDKKKKEFKCSECGKVFATNSNLLRHQANPCQSTSKQTKLSAPVVRNLKCPYEGCIYMASTITQLHRHRTQYHNEAVRYHECSVCSFRAKQASHLRRHQQGHAGGKPYACPHCQFTCASLENLRKHFHRFHESKGLYLYTCPDCNIFAANKATELRTHLTTQHGTLYDYATAVDTVKNILKATDQTANG